MHNEFTKCCEKFLKFPKPNELFVFQFLISFVCFWFGSTLGSAGHWPGALRQAYVLVRHQRREQKGISLSENRTIHSTSRVYSMFSYVFFFHLGSWERAALWIVQLWRVRSQMHSSQLISRINKKRVVKWAEVNCSQFDELCFLYPIVWISFTPQW